MSANEKKFAILVGAVVGCAYLSKVASREAKQLGIPAIAITAASWFLAL